MAVRSKDSSIWHHGIYSDGKVYHVTEDGKSQATLSLDYLMKFIAGNIVTFVLQYPESGCLSPKEVIARARQIFTTKKWPENSLIWDNCEHFATFCKTGKKYSIQVWDEVQRIIAAGVDGYKFAGSPGMSVGLLGASASLGFRVASGSDLHPNSDGHAKKKN